MPCAATLICMCKTLEKKYWLLFGVGWIQFNIDGKPTFALFHKSYLRVNETCALMCFRHFYVSQGHNSVQAFGGSFPVPQGTMIMYASRTSTDLVAGFGGRILFPDEREEV